MGLGVGILCGAGGLEGPGGRRQSQIDVERELDSKREILKLSYARRAAEGVCPYAGLANRAGFAR
jgi:hypothetical protein